MEQLSKITIKTTAAGAASLYSLLIELLVGATSLEQLLPVLIVKELVLRIGRNLNPWADARKAVRICLSPAEAVSVRTLILQETLPPSMVAVAREIMAVIDPQLPIMERLVQPVEQVAGCRLDAHQNECADIQ